MKIAAEPEILNLVVSADRAQQVSNLLLGAVHFLLLSGAQHPLADFYPSLSKTPRSIENAYPHFHKFCLEYAGEIQRLVITHRVQTNEVGRCTNLLPAFGLIYERTKKPLALIEVGASAGLNLLWDRYGYDYQEAGYTGDISSSVQLTCRPDGDFYPPIPFLLPEVAYRVGIDLRPIDLQDGETIRWLRALIWPEHLDRAELLERAIEIARRDPPRLIGGNVLDDAVGESICGAHALWFVSPSPLYGEGAGG